MFSSLSRTGGDLFRKRLLLPGSAICKSCGRAEVRPPDGTSLSINEISAKSGFASSSHLNALFRHTYGMTMRDWRSQAEVDVSGHA